MIPKFPAFQRLNGPVVAMLALALGCFTFTRAAGQGKKPQVAAEATLELVPATAKPESGADFDALKERLAELEARIAAQEQSVNRLRRELAIPRAIAEGHADSTSEELVRFLERQRIGSESAAARYQMLLSELKSRTASQIAQTIPTAIPDEELTRLLRDLNTAETALARNGVDHGPDHPSLKATESTIKKLRSQIDARVEGILSGLSAQVAAERASAETLGNRIEATTREDAERAELYRPYFRAKRDLETLEKVRDSLMLRLLRRQFGIED